MATSATAAATAVTDANGWPLERTFFGFDFRFVPIASHKSGFRFKTRSCAYTMENSKRLVSLNPFALSSTIVRQLDLMTNDTLLRHLIRASDSVKTPLRLKMSRLITQVRTQYVACLPPK